MAQTFENILAGLKAGNWAPVYILHGEEDYYIDRIADYIEQHVLDESDKAFNQHILYGKETDFRSLLDVLRRYPMMAQYQVVILKEAQQMRTLSNLDVYLENPASTSIFVICHKHKKLDKRTRFGKLAAKNCVEFYARPLRDYQVVDWIINYVRSEGFKISHEAAILLEEFQGSELSLIAGSIEKLKVNMQAGDTITPDLIQQYIGISKHYNAFELQNALMNRNEAKAYKIVKYFGANPKAAHINMVLATLYAFFSKLFVLHHESPDSGTNIASFLGVHPFVAKQYLKAKNSFNAGQVSKALRILYKTDLRSKGVDNGSAGQEALMIEMVYKIIQA